MSDNLLLTLLGAVSVGALVMSMNKDEEVRENFWNGIQLSSQRVTMEMRPDGSFTEVNQRDPSHIKSNLSLLEIKGQNQMANRLIQQEELLEEREDTQENFVHPAAGALGSGMVTDNNYVSYPEFNQSVSAPSPSMNLPAQIRYNPPSTSTMGITENFACNTRPMNSGTVVEGYMSMDQTNPSPSPGYAGGNYNKVIQNVSENKGLNVESGRAIPVDEDGGGNVMLFDRYMVVPGKAAGRFNRGNGVVDRIRGDLPVCVDPCQKGWFASPGNPSQLAAGALSVIGGSGEQANAVANFKQLYGAQLHGLQTSGGGNSQMNMLSQITPTSNTVSVSTFH
jgi:hypothetical protein